MLFQLMALRPAQEFAGFVSVQWTNPVGNAARDCPVIEAASAVFPALRVLELHGRDEPIQCVSNSIPMSAALEYEYSLTGGRGASIELIDSTGSVLDRFIPGKSDGEWRFRRFTPNPAADAGATVTLRARSSRDTSAVMRIRTRINRYTLHTSESRLHSLMENPENRSMVTLLAAGVLLCLALRRPLEGRSLEPAVFVLLAIGVHFRPHLYFAFDEWHLLDRIRGSGLRAIWISHNEHFIPVAVLLAWLEYQVFGSWYDGFLFVSLIVHGLAGYQLRKFLEDILPPEEAWRRASAFLAIFYTIHGLHSEALEWCMCQGTVVASLATVCALRALVRCFRTGSLRTLLCLLGWVACALFSFAGSFILVAEAPLLLLGLLAAPWRDENTANEPGVKWQRAMWLTGSVTLLAAFAALLYAHAKDAGGLRFTEPHIADRKTVALYIASGTQFGTVVRGLGLYRRVEHERFADSLPRPVRHAFGPLGSAAAGGAAMSLLILLFALQRSRGVNRRSAISSWCLGQMFLALPFVITAIARAQFGAQYAVRSLRYQTPALIGLVILLIPLAGALSRLISAPSRPARAAAMLVLWAAFAAQLEFASRFDTFRDIGAVTHRYVSQLKSWGGTDWQEQPFERAGGLQGDYPILYWGREERAVAIPTPVHPWTMLNIVEHRSAE